MQYSSSIFCRSVSLVINVRRRLPVQTQTATAPRRHDFRRRHSPATSTARRRLRTVAAAAIGSRDRQVPRRRHGDERPAETPRPCRSARTRVGRRLPSAERRTTDTETMSIAVMMMTTTNWWAADWFYSWTCRAPQCELDTISQSTKTFIQAHKPQRDNVKWIHMLKWIFKNKMYNDNE